MAISGDLSTIDLPDLFQNIEVHSRSGTLSLSGDDGAARICFRDGHVTALRADGRAPLADRLVAADYVTARRMENARKKQRSGKRSIVELLVAGRAMTTDELHEVAAHFLSEDVADLIASAQGEFQFVEGEPDVQDFDADEFALDLKLPAQALVLEATRRVDHWVEIRKILPSYAMHFQARDSARVPDEVEDLELAESILDALDGSRSVCEIAELFPDRRFDCFNLLAELVRAKQARPTTADDLLGIAEELEKLRPERARDLVRRGLDDQPHHLGLLSAESRLSERLEDTEAAASAAKLIAHLELEAGRTESAMEHLEKARNLTPNDPAIVERCVSVALLQGRRQEALHEGLRLVELYRAPGLHARAKEVLERLARVDPESIDLEVELARSRVDCGETAPAIKQLMRRGKALVASTNYIGAHILFEAVLGIEPGHREAALSIEMIDKDTYAHRRERKRRAIRLTLLACAVALTGFLTFLETSARLAYMETRTTIGEEYLIEQRHYEEAIALWQQMANEHPFSLTAQLDVPRLIAEIEARRD